MAQCRICQGSELPPVTNAPGLCKPCERAVRPDAMARIARVNDALTRLRSSTDADSQLAHVRTAIAELEALRRNEEHKLARLRPKPSMLLRVLTEKGEQLSREQRRQTASPVVADSRKTRSAPIPNAEVGSQSVPRHLEKRVITLPRFDRGELHPSEWLSSGVDESLLDEYLYRPNRKRPGKRGEHRGEVNCPVHVEPGGIRGTVRDLSAGGLFLHTHTPFSEVPGSPVRLTLSTSNGPIRAEGVVRWVERGRGADRYESRVGMGVEFTNASQQLTDYVHRDVPAPPV
jgi:hypothetical protein